MAQLNRRPGAAHRLPDPARPGRRHVADRHLPDRACSTRSRRRSPRARASSCTPSRSSTPAAARSSLAADRDPAGRARRAAGPARAAAHGPRRRGAVRRRPQAPAAVPARACVGLVCGRGVGRRAGRRSRTPAGAGRRSSSAVENVAVQGADAVTEVTDGAAAPGRATPRSTSSWSPAAAARSRTCCRSPTRPGAGRGRLPHAGRQRDRPRAGHPAARPRRRRPRLDADRRRHAGRARRRRGARPHRDRPRRAPGPPSRPCSTASSTGSTPRAAARCWPTRTSSSRAAATTSRRCAARCGTVASRHRLDRAADDVGAHPGPRPCRCRPRRPSSVATRWCSAPTAPSSRDPADVTRGSGPAGAGRGRRRRGHADA